MRLKTVYELVDKLAPFALSKEECEVFGHYDNSGILVDCGGEIKGILFSLDLSKAAIEAAKKAGANCIVTHHPAIFGPLKSLKEEGEGSLVLACVAAGISVISAHLNLDTAEGGIDAGLMEGLGGKTELAVLEQLHGGCYGRVYDVEECTLNAFVKNAEQTFSTKRILAYGNAPVKRVASFCGSGFSDDSLAFAMENGADTLVSSDGKHHLIAEAVEHGMNVILLTHYAAENYGFLRFAQKMEKALEGRVRTDTFTDERLL